MFLAAHQGMGNISSLTRNQTCVPCIVSMESSSLDYQGTPEDLVFNEYKFSIFKMQRVLEMDGAC